MGKLIYGGVRPKRWRIAHLFFLIFSVAATLPAQNVLRNHAAPCTSADLDVSIKFANIPPYTEIVALNYRNVSQHACSVQGFGVGLDNVKEGHNIWTKECWNCSADGQERDVGPLMLPIGGIAHMELSWQTIATDNSISCQESGGLHTNAVMVVAPSLIRQLCSIVQVRGFIPGTFEEDRQSETENRSDEKDQTIELTSSSPVIYTSDYFDLHVMVKGSTRLLPLNGDLCPTLFLRTRALDGKTVFQEERHSPCKVRTSQITMDLLHTAGGEAAFEGSTDRKVEVFVLAGC